jgi:PadR family transcriptional regulator PadR
MTLLTFTGAQVASVLLADPETELYGMQIYKAAGSTPGTVYPLLDRWKELGWLETRNEGMEERATRSKVTNPRKYWKVTAEGRVELGKYLRKWNDRQRGIRVSR